MAAQTNTPPIKKVLYKQDPVIFSPKMDVPELFLQLTSRTCPWFPDGDRWDETYEVLLYGKSLFEMGATMDAFGNFHYIIPKADGSESRTLFLAHLDTVPVPSSMPTKVVHRFSHGRNSVWTDGFTCLGADNKAGVTILLKMIDARVPGHYIFTIAEESGCIGSTNLVELDERYEPPYTWNAIDRAISFDREGTSDIITHMRIGRTCSTAFAKALAAALNARWAGFEYKPCDRGSMTDSGVWADITPECTNISTGTFRTHTVGEKQNLAFLQRLAEAAIAINWEELPVARQIATFSPR